MLSKRAKNLKPSATLALGAKARKLKAQGVDVISLTLGEPTWNTPEAVCLAGIQAIKEGHTKYTPAHGMAQLQQAIIANTKKNLKLEVTPSQVTVSIGAKFILFSALQALCDPEDEVLIPSPYWVSYPAMVKLAHARFVPLPTRVEENFALKPKTLQEHITPKTKALILNSPNNPTGAVLSAEDLQALAKVLLAHPQIHILSDDIYNHLYFKGSMAPHLLQVSPALKDRTLIINAVSKNYSMTGWRVGWAVGNEEVISAMSRLQSQSVSCAPSVSQVASAYALNHCDKELDKIRQNLLKMRNTALEAFRQIEGLTVFPPEGTFYFWVGVKKLYGRSCKGKPLQSSADFVEALLREQKVLCVPGEEFGCPGYVRMHFAVNKEVLDAVCLRLKNFISSLS